MGEQRHDYVALDWVKQELEETLKSAQQSLERFVEEQDHSAIEECQTFLSQVRGTLQMLQFFGAALLAEEIEHLAKALGEKKVSDERNAQELLMQSMLQLPKYLEYIKRGHRDLPVVLLPVLNDLRSARGERLLTETTVFNPDISNRFSDLPAEVLDKLASSEFMGLVRKLRQMYQVALTGFIRQENERQNLDYLLKIFLRLIKLCGRTPLGQLWLLGSALCEAVMEDGLQNSTSVKTLLRKIDKELKVLAETGAHHLNSSPNPDLMRNLLYLIAKSEQETQRVKQVRDLFDLHGTLPTEEELQEERTILSSPDNDTIGSVVTALQEEIGRLKEQLDQAVSLPEGQQGNLASLPVNYKQIGDTLNLLGLHAAHEMMQAEVPGLTELSVSDQAIQPNQLASAVNTLLKVEGAVVQFAGKDTSGNAGQLNNAQQVVVREARHLLEAVKETINDYLATHHETESFSHLGDWLSKLSGSLRMIPLNEAAQLVDSIHQVVREHLLEVKPPNEAIMEPLATAMSGLEYYLERIVNDGIYSNLVLLDKAEAAIDALISPVAKAEIEARAEQAALEALRRSQASAASLSDAQSVDQQVDSQQVDSQQVDSQPAEPQKTDSQPIAAPAVSQSEPEQSAAEAESQEDDLIDDEIIEIFLEEAEEVLETIGEFWPQLQANRSDDEALSTIRRAFHTLKGSGRMVGAEDIGELAWSIENMLNRIIDNSISLNDNVMDVIDHVIELLPDTVQSFKNRKPLPFDPEPVQNYAFALAGGREVNPIAEALAASSEHSVAEESDSASQEEAPAAQVSEVAVTVSNVLGDDEEEADPALLEIFISEVEGHLETVSEFLTDAVANDYEEPLPDSVQRAYHTIKGSANLAKIPSMAAVAGRLENLVKELRIFQVGNSRELNELLQEGYDLMEQAFRSTTGSASAIMPEEAQVETYISSVNELKRRLTDAASSSLTNLTSKQPAFADPQVLSQFLSEGMDISLDTDKQLEHWRASPGASEYIEPLQDALQRLEQGAKKVGLLPIEQLTSALKGVYERVPMQNGTPSHAFFDLVSQGHEGLLEMMDQVAAAQIIQPKTELIQVLRQGLEPYFVATASESLDSLMETTFDELADNEDSAVSAAPEAAESAADLDSISLDLGSLDSLEGDDSDSEAVDHPASEHPASEHPASEHQVSGSSESVVSSPEAVITPQEPAAACTSAVMPTNVPPEEIVADDEMLEIFMEEAFELLDSASEALNRWQKDPNNLIEVAKLQRDLHTFKGGARMAEISSIGDLTHELEFLYEAVNDGRRNPSDDLFQVLHLCHDRLADMASAVQEGRALYPALDLVPVLQRFIKEGQLQSVPAPCDGTGKTAPEPAAPAVTAAAAIPKAPTPLKPSPPAPSKPAAAVPKPQVAVVQTQVTPPPPAAMITALPELNDDDKEVVEIFLDEAGELIEATDKAIHAWEQEPDNMVHSEELQRHLHTLKGGARLAGLVDVGNYSHDFESMLVKWALQQGQADPAFFEDLHKRFDIISDQVEYLQKWIAGDLAEPSEDADTSNNQAVQAAANKVVELNKAREEQQARKQKEMVKVSADLLEGLVNLAGETSIARGRLEQQVSDFGNILEEMDTTIERLREQLRRLDIETEAQILFRQEVSGPDYEDFDPLEMDRYSTLQQLSRALVESSYDLLDLKETLVNRARDAESLLLQQSRVNTELQEGLMKTRMVPFSRLVPRLRRIVRQTASELGKKVEFEAVNAEGELDRTLLERMVGPLEHMLRNAVDHGVEMPDVRVNNGKDEMGMVTLTLSREGGDVVLRLKDDGGGINANVIRKKAIEKGIMKEGDTLSDHEIYQFIMQAGFSTAQQVTQISGRGVGMDVVRSEIKQMGGNVSIDAQLGLGTEFTVSVPFTVSVNRALMVNVGEDMYAIPLTTIEGIVRVSPYELEELYRSDIPQFDYAGETYRLDYMGNLLRNGTSPKLQGQPLPLPVVLVRGAEPAALQVDALLGSREIVVKALGPQFNTVVGVSGGTILGDGSVVVILDLGNMVRHLRSIEYLQHLEQEEQAAAQAAEARRAARPASILVVDDSVTVRKVTTRLLERQGMEVRTAKDGVDAMNALQDKVPDLVLLDIEMPRMDGFEVASLMRHDPVLKDVPIIMITSRTGEKHKERAMAIGVTEYMGKPFQEDILLTSIRKLTGRQ